MKNDPHKAYLLSALVSPVRLHTSHKQLSRQRLYALARQLQIKTIKIIDGPRDELWLLPKEPKEDGS
jgi:hypothetical protein